MSCGIWTAVLRVLLLSNNHRHLVDDDVADRVALLSICSKQLWQLLHSTCNWSHVAFNSAFESFGLALTANDVNAYFADIATDPHYSHDILCCLHSFINGDLSLFVPFTADSLTTFLSRIRSTSPGPEWIPFSMYRRCAEELGPVLAIDQFLYDTAYSSTCLENCSYHSGSQNVYDYRTLRFMLYFSNIYFVSYYWKRNTVVKNYLIPLFRSTSSVCL